MLDSAGRHQRLFSADTAQFDGFARASGGCLTDAEQEPGSDKAVPGYAVMERQVHFLVKQHRRQQQQVGIKARGPCNSCLVEIASPQQQQAEEWIYCLQ